MLRKKQMKIILFLLLMSILIIIPNYSNAARITVGKVTGVAAKTNNVNDIDISWKGVSKATGYRVYVYNSSNKKYEYKGKTTSRLYTLKKLKSATQYKIKIRAYRTVKKKNYYGNYSNILITATKPTEVKNLKANAQSDTTITLSWDKVARASGYRVYVYNDATKKYEYKAQTIANSIKIASLAQAKIYKIRVRAYKTSNNKNYYGAYSTVITTVTKPSKVTGLHTESNTTSSIELRWNRISGATGYRVYMYNSSTKSYDYKGQVTDNQFTVNELKLATGYYFKVRAFITFNNTKYYGSYSDILDTATQPNRVTGLKVVGNTTESSITIEWNKVDNVEGYAVYISGAVSYKLYKTTTDTTMTISNLDAARFYKIYVKTYVTINKKTYYSESSNVISQKTNSTDTIKAGIDVSRHQGVIDWEKVQKVGVDFAILRCGYGRDIQSQDDGQFKRNVAECERLKIPYGVYIYSYALNTDDAKSEAEHTLRLLNGHKPDYGVWFDMEDADDYKKKHGMPSNKTLVNICTTFCDILNEKGYNAGIYACLNWFDNQLNSSKLDKYPKWVAQWGNSCTYKKEYQVWQYSDAGIISGISGNIDLDIIYIDKWEKVVPKENEEVIVE